MKSGAKNASATLQGSLATQRDVAAGDLKTASASEVAPDTQAPPPKAEMKTEQVGSAPAPVSAAPVVPAPMPAEQLDYSSDRGETDTAMADAGVTTEQLGKGNEPQFNKTLAERNKAEEHEKSVEPKYRASETKIHAQTRKEAQGEIGAGLAGIHDERELQLGKVTTQQTTTKTKDAAERQRITTTINAIKDQTRTDVTEILNGMEKTASQIFEDGLKRAEDAYDNAFEEAKGGIGTWLTTWGDDWKEHIESSLGTARREYLRQVGIAIDEVADLVDTKLAAAKKRVAAGRQQVEDFVKTLDKSVAEFGEEALKEVSSEFDAMGSEIDDRRDKLVDSLAQQYKASYERMSAREEALREANKSLWERVYDATVGVIKKIIAFKNMLLDVLRKAANVIMDIISDPIGFLGNLVTGVMRGLEGFMSRIGEHLKKGLMEWLFGELAAGGLQMPENFDLQGIVSIILQVLGLTYANFRARAVAIVGEPVVAALEQAAEIFKILVTEGIPGLWRFIKEKVSDLKSMVMDAIFDFIKEKVIVAGITWVIGLLNPASAFFKACKAIYDIVMFFINRGSQILELVNAIIDSIAAIAKGSLDTAAKWVENALAKAIPVAIGFLASLLGLGDISGTVKKTIDKAREPVNKAIDWAINLAVKGVKALGKLFTGGDKKKEEAKSEPPALNDPEKEAKLKAGLVALDAADQKYAAKGGIELEQAHEVAASVQKEHPIFKSITVVSIGERWDYEYVVNPTSQYAGAHKRTGILTVQTINVTGPEAAALDRAEAAASQPGKKYEQAVMNKLTADPSKSALSMRPELMTFAGVSKMETTVPPITKLTEEGKEKRTSRKESSQSTVRLQQQMAMRQGEFEPVPEARMEAIGPGGTVTKVATLEVTLVDDFHDVPAATDPHKVHAIRKAKQFITTVDTLVAKYKKYPTVEIQMYFFCPREPSDETKDYIAGVIESHPDPLAKNIKVIWKVLKTK